AGARRDRRADRAAGRPDRGGRYAAGGRDHPGGAGPDAAGAAPGAEHRSGVGDALPARRAVRPRRQARGGCVMDTSAGVEACVPIRSDMDLVWVRQHVRQSAAGLGFGLVDQTKLVTAASELARNTLVHGGGGRMEISAVSTAGVAGLRLSFIDEGPGIP